MATVGMAFLLSPNRPSQGATRGTLAPLGKTNRPPGHSPGAGAGKEAGHEAGDAPVAGPAFWLETNGHGCRVHPWP